jgi:ABC-type bacteriocin/lantibiotic exporter with double-glycine peptidase domain
MINFIKINNFSAKKYLSEILFLSSHNNKNILYILNSFLILGVIDLIGIGLIGQYISLCLGVQTPFSFLSSLEIAKDNARLFFSIAIISIFLIKLILGVFSNYLIFKISADIEVELRVRLLEKYQKMDYQNWLLRSPSEYIAAINIWVPQYSRLVLLPSLRLLAELIIGSLILIFLLYTSPVIFLLFMSVTFFTAFFYEVFFRKNNKKFAELFRELSSLIISDVREAIDGFKEIRITRSENFFLDKIKVHSNDLSNALAKANTISNSSRFFIEFSLVIFLVFLFSFFLSNSEDAINFLPLAAMFGFGLIRIASMFSSVATSVSQLSFNRKIVSSLFNDLEMPSNVKYENLNSSSIVFRNISTSMLGFRYFSGGDYVLKDIDLNFKQGEYILLLGNSGSGKSTLLDLFLGILKPTKGTILINDDISIPNLADFSSYIPQEIFLIDDTILKNIAIGENESEIDINKVNAAIKNSRLDSYVNSLPMGLNSRIGDRGAQLSGGQRQRIALARAFYSNKQIIFLDEATSAIDLQTETEILNELLSMKGRITLFVVSHRSEISSYFDKVFLLENGSVKEFMHD